MLEPKNRKKFDYTWIIIILCFLMVSITLGFASSTKSLFPDEIAKDLGTKRSLVSIGESCRYIATAVVNIFFGFSILKFGAKKLILAGLICVSGSMFLYSIANNLLVIYIAGTLLGVGFSWTSTTMVGYVVGVWCSKNKGTIMGLVLASNGLGGAIAVQIVGGIINPDVVGSYRSAYRLIAIVIACLSVIMLLFFKNKPKNHVLTETEKSTKKKRGQDWVGIEFNEAIKKFYFWGTIICVFFSGMILQGSHGIVAMHYKDVGIDYSKVKALLSFGSLILASAKFIIGFIYDKKGLRTTANICTVIAILTTFQLAFIKGNELGFILAVMFAVVSQFAMPLETIMLPIYASDLFGQKSYAKILGLIVSANVAGYAVGSPVMNLCYDIFNSYVPALYLVGGIMIGVLILLQFVISSAHKEKNKILAQQNKEELPTKEAQIA